MEIDCRDNGLKLKQIVRALAGFTENQHKQIRKTFKSIYGEELTEHLNRMVADDQAKDALSMWMLDPHQRDAKMAREAIQQSYTNYKTLVEIFVGRKSSHIFHIKQAYQALFKRKLDQDIRNIEPPHSYQKILISLSASHKAHKVDISQHIAKCDARRLYETGERSRAAIDESVVLEILSKRSIPQLKLTFCSYKHIYGHDYTQLIKNRNSIEFSSALRMVVKCICNPPHYHAKALNETIKGTTSEMEEIEMVLKKKLSFTIPPGDLKDLVVALATTVYKKELN